MRYLLLPIVFGVFLVGILSLPYMMTTANAVVFQHMSSDGSNGYLGMYDASIDIEGLDGHIQWLQGMPLTVEVYDPDVNRDSQSVETLSLSTAYDNILVPVDDTDPGYDNVIWLQRGSVPYLKIGQPQMMSPYNMDECHDAQECAELAGVQLHVSHDNSGDGYCYKVTNFCSDYSYPWESGIAIVHTHLTDDIAINNGDSLIIFDVYRFSGGEDSNITADHTAFRFLNYDLSSLNDKLASGKINTISIMLEWNGDYSSVVNLATVSELKGYLQIPKSITDELITNSGEYSLKIVFDDVDTGTKYSPQTEMAVAADFFTFGVNENSGNWINNAIYRLEAVETGADTSTFTGTIEFVRMTSNSVDDVSFFSNLRTFGNSILFTIDVMQDGTWTGSHAPRMKYVDLDALQSFTVMGSQHDAFPRAVISDVSVTTDEDTTVAIPIESDDFMGIDSSFSCCDNIYDEGQNAGDIDILSDFELVYTPELNFVGTASMEIYSLYEKNNCCSSIFPFTATITVNPVNDPPVATYDGSSVPEDYPNASITLSGTDVDGDVLSYIVVTQPTHGTLTGTAPNLFYTPNANYNGMDSFTFKVSDGILDSPIETYDIGVDSVNDMPVADAGSDQSVDPNSIVQLDGSQSSDADGHTLTYFWIQTAGYPVTLTADNIASPQFTAPSQGDQLTFMLTVNDGIVTSNPNIINIYVGESIPEPTPPPAPGSVASSASDSQITLTWSTPSDDGGSVITDYLVEYATADGGTWLAYNDGTSTATSATITGLSNGQEYNFRISAVNSEGIGDASQSVDATPSVQPEVEPEEPEIEPVEPEVEPVEPEIIPEEPEPVMDIQPDAEPGITSEAVPAFEPEPKSEAAQSSAGCGAGTVMVNGVCQVAKTSGTSMAIEPMYIVIAAVAVGGVAVGALFALKRGSGTPKPAREELEEYESKYVARKPAEKKETSSSCSNCGASLKPTAKFCGSCGNQV